MVRRVTMIETVAIGVIALIQLAVSLRLRHLSRAAAVFQYCRVTEEEPWIPDGAIKARKPVVFWVPELKKNLFLLPLAIEPHRLLMKRFLVFFGKYRAALDGIPILTGSELDTPMASQIAGQYVNAFSASKRLTADALAIVEAAFLRDKRMNPHRIRRRDLARCGIDTIAALWLRARERNVDCVRDFIASLLGQLQAGNRKSIAGSGLSANAEYLSKISQPTPYRVPFYWPNGSRSAERGKSIGERLNGNGKSARKNGGGNHGSERSGSGDPVYPEGASR